MLPVTPTFTLPEPKGVVFTKRWVVELLLDLAGYIPSVNLVDSIAVEPSAGDGAFLRVMVERLLDSCRRFGRAMFDCESSIIAFELNDLSATKARQTVVDVLVNGGVDASLAHRLAGTWVRTGDYLLDSMSIEADFVLGNPPYVRLEEIPEEVASTYRRVYQTMYGRADMYVAFFEAALRQLRQGGTCAFICADRWMRNQYGAELRELITSKFAVDVILEMHKAAAFQDDVDAYPAISVIRRRAQGPVVVASAGQEIENTSTTELAELFSNTRMGGTSSQSIGLKTARVDTWFKGGDPWPCQSPEQLSLLRRLEEQFSPLERNAKVGIGVATGHDKVFITKDAHLVEPSRLLKLAVAKDIASGTMRWSGNFLIDPWSEEGLVRLEKYPKLDAYFNQHGLALKNRHAAIKSAHAWYKTIDRVTHSLAEKPKLYIADIRNTLEPVLDTGETYPHHNLYFIHSDVWDLEVLGGLLLSAIGQFFVESYGVRMRGGYLRFQAQYLRRIRVPVPSAISRENAEGLRLAFRQRDKVKATKIALTIYEIKRHELEQALGY
jgi:adenine-specific DNA-methyltransferase